MRLSLLSLSSLYSFFLLIRSSQLGYCIRDSAKFHLLSLSTSSSGENEHFLHRNLQCNSLRSMFFSPLSPRLSSGPIQRYRIGLASFDWNYFDEDRLVLLSGKEYFDYVIPTRSMIVCSSLLFSFDLCLFGRVILLVRVFCGRMVSRFIRALFLKILNNCLRK